MANKIVKGVKYEVLFKDTDDSGYEEVVYTAPYECIDRGEGYGEFVAADPKKQKMERLYPGFIGTIAKDEKGNEVCVDKDYDNGWYLFSKIEALSAVLCYNGIIYNI